MEIKRLAQSLQALKLHRVILPANLITTLFNMVFAVVMQVVEQLGLRPPTISAGDYSYQSCNAS